MASSATCPTGWPRSWPALGLPPGAAVGVMMDQNPEMPAALLGVLKAGCAYVPIDPTYPARRVAQIVADSGIDTVIVDALNPCSLPTSGRSRSPPPSFRTLVRRTAS